MAIGEGAQEDAERRGRAQLLVEQGRGRAGAQGGGVVDAVAAGESGVDEGERLHAGAGGAGGAAEVDVLVEELLEAQPAGQGGGQKEAGVGHNVGVGEAY